MTQGTLVKVVGVMEELTGTKSGTKHGRSWKIYNFTIKKLTGGIAKCSTFGEFDKELLGEIVEFDAEYNERFSSYAVKGEIKIAEDVEEEETPKEVAVAPKRRGRKPKNTKTKKEQPVEVKQRTVESDLEAVRDDAVKIFEQDVDDVSRVLSEYSKDSVTSQALSVGVQALQAIRATLFIEQNKRERSFS